MDATHQRFVVTSLGDNALVVLLDLPAGRPAAESPARVRAVADAVRNAHLPGVVDVVPSPDRVTIVCVPDAALGQARRPPGRPGRPPAVPSADPRQAGSSIARLVPDVERIARDALAAVTTDPGTCHDIEVAYGGEDGPDLDDVCRSLGIDHETFVRLHTTPDYLVTAIGFVPGFPYLAGLPAQLALPRRATPRTRVPAGSVGIAAGQTGIYPFATPGGWHLVGRSAVCLFDPWRTPSSLLQVGDRVRFVATRPARLAATRPAHASPAPSTIRASTPRAARHISIISPGLHTTVQDLGRPGQRHAGVPTGGAADPIALRLANLAVGNPPDAAGLECTLTGPDIRFDRDAMIAVAGATFAGLPHGRPIHVEAGTVVSLGHARHGCRAYLAVAGGICVERVLGSRSTYVPAAFGGVEGRPLAAGDVLALGRATTRTTGDDWSLAPATVTLPPATTLLRIIAAAPHGTPDVAWHATYRVTARSDRMGVRLEGQAVPASGIGTSVAVLPGSVQVPPDGRPIILLADAQTIGGYDVLGQVILADLPLVAQLRPGDILRFEPTDAMTAHDALRGRERLLGLARAAVATRTVTVHTIDLNADVGEGAPHDAVLMPLVSSVNVACGGHAGDPSTMRATVELARRHGVAIGAHPGHADRRSFGRVPLPITPDEAATIVVRQVEELAVIAGDDLRHVKLHGALYHQVARDHGLATGVAERLARRWPRLHVVAPTGSLFAEIAAAHGLVVWHEAFVDRAYAPDGFLVPRSRPGAVLAEPARAAAQAVHIARDARVRTVDGGALALRADTLCIHGDGVDPVACARAVRRGLAFAGVDVARP